MNSLVQKINDRPFVIYNLRDPEAMFVGGRTLRYEWNSAGRPFGMDFYECCWFGVQYAMSDTLRAIGRLQGIIMAPGQ